VLVEVIVLLGETINEEILDTSLAEILIQDALVYFFPEQQIKTLIRWDV
jgi:hypothetical protein